MVRRACAYTKRPWWNPLAEMHMIWHPIRLFSTDWKIFPRKLRRTRSSFSGCLLIYCYKDDLRWWILVIVILLENDRDKVSLDIVIRSTWLSGNHKKSLGSEDISSEVYFSFPNRNNSSGQFVYWEWQIEVAIVIFPGDCFIKRNLIPFSG